jgi:hypothetical protein
MLPRVEKYCGKRRKKSSTRPVVKKENEKYPNVTYRC